MGLDENDSWFNLSFQYIWRIHCNYLFIFSLALRQIVNFVNFKMKNCWSLVLVQLEEEGGRAAAGDGEGHVREAEEEAIVASRSVNSHFAADQMFQKWPKRCALGHPSNFGRKSNGDSKITKFGPKSKTYGFTKVAQNIAKSGYTDQNAIILLLP